MTVTTPKEQVRLTVNRLIQIFTVLAAMVVAFLLVSKTEPETPPPPFDMLAYLDAQVATQEDGKDVRCWSSLCKLQMFLTGAPIDDQAIGVRIESHMGLIESIWEQAGVKHPYEPMISEATVAEILDRRFPYYRGEKGIRFDMGGALVPIDIITDAMLDYSDTVEPWRLLQSWASYHTDLNGRLSLKPQFNQQALHVLHEFLLNYDLAIMKYARRIAEGNKASRIDASAMSEAFDLESKLR